MGYGFGIQGFPYAALRLIIEERQRISGVKHSRDPLIRAGMGDSNPYVIYPAHMGLQFLHTKTPTLLSIW